MTTATEVLGQTIAAIRAQHEWVQLSLATDDDAGEWTPLEVFATPDIRDRMAQALGELEEHEDESGETPITVLGNYLFRELTFYPLFVAGCCFAADRRVLCLEGAFEFRTDQVGPARIRSARFAVLPDDPLAGEPGIELEPDEHALTERLHAEVRAVCDPLLASFREPRYVASANGWGSILDSLHDGFTTAGRIGLGLDEAWKRWDEAIAGRSFPVRRRPRRLPYKWAPGQHDEVSVRAGCCLWYVTDDSRKDGCQEYCSSCYLETDERRIQHLVEWKQQLPAGEVEHH